MVFPPLRLQMEDEAKSAIAVAEKKAQAERPKDGIPGKAGVYMPPHKMREMLKNLSQDKKGLAFQRAAWEALRKSINGLINKVCRDRNRANCCGCFELGHLV